MSGWLARLFGGEAESSNVTRARIHAERSLMALEGVVSVGTGLDDGREAIVVGVADETCAVAQAMPAQVDGVPVVVRSIGELRAEGASDGLADTAQEGEPS